MRRHAYSVIEILIVVVIIGILSSITTVMYQNAQMKARDATRKRDVQNIKVAVTAYFQVNKCYPAAGDDTTFNPLNAKSCVENPTSSSMYAACANYSNFWENVLKPNLIPYLGILPNDPKANCNRGVLPHLTDTGYGHVYMYAGENNIPQNGGDKYVIWAALENPNDPDRNMAATSQDKTGVGGKYSSLFKYANLPSFTSNNPDLRPLYGAGCHLMNPANQASLCINN